MLRGGEPCGFGRFFGEMHERPQRPTELGQGSVLGVRDRAAFGAGWRGQDQGGSASLVNVPRRRRRASCLGRLGSGRSGGVGDGDSLSPNDLSRNVLAQVSLVSRRTSEAH